MTPIKRHGIYLANLDPTIGAEMNKTRPVVVVSGDHMNRHLQTVVTCPLTTTLHPTWRSRIEVTGAGRAAEIAVDQIRTLAKKRLVRELGALTPDDALKLRLLITEMYGEG